jgi:ketosteroid isomerase-like protein
MSSVKEKIDKQNAKFMEYFKKHDAKGLASLYTEDACFMAANAPLVHGHLEPFFTEFFKTGVKEIKLMTEELHDLGEFIAERSRYELTVQPPGMSPMVDKGKYVVVWKKTPSGYKIYWDIMNSDLPPPPT